MKEKRNKSEEISGTSCLIGVAIPKNTRKAMEEVRHDF